MKKIFSSLKGLNMLGIAMVAITAITMMSFKAETKAMKLYGYDREDQVWIDLTSKTEGVNPGNYQCDLDTENKNCTALFDHVPAPNEQPVSGRKGIFSIVE